MTKDDFSGLEIRPTDNGLKKCDKEAPQINRPLTQDEIAEIIKKAGK